MKKANSCLVEWAAVAVLVCSSSPCASAEPDLALEAAGVPQGEYHGSIWADAMRECVTEFYGESKGGIDGTYRFDYDGAPEEGFLVNCRRVAGDEFRCGWKDRWGAGKLDLTFSADLSSFTGVWSDENNPPSLGLRWNGVRRPQAGE